MNSETSVEQLLRWRLARAEAEAPPAPRAARLLEMARPWWEAWPKRFQSLAERLSGIEFAYGHAMADAAQTRRGHPVPTLISGQDGESETLARMHYLSLSEGRFRLRFQLDRTPEPEDADFEATFVSHSGASSGQPLFAAPAVRSLDGEYRLEAELPDELSKTWASLKVTDRMPFRLILLLEGGRRQEAGGGKKEMGN